MKLTILIFLLPCVVMGQGNEKHLTDYEIIKTESHVAGLEVALIHAGNQSLSADYPVLFLHGSSFPSALSFRFRMDGVSWMDQLAANGFDVYALDFPGYGYSDRYPEMYQNSNEGSPLGRALEVCMDVNKAVDLILEKTGKTKIHIIGHSWGGSVAAYYVARFPDKVSRLVLFAAITLRESATKAKTINRHYNELTPVERINSLKQLTPEDEICRLEPELFQVWGDQWKASDPLTSQLGSAVVRYPAGPTQDVEDLLHSMPYYDLTAIEAPVLIVRGEWDRYPDNEDAISLFESLNHSAYKKYVVIEKGTHVMHLEKSRHQLYYETVNFLKYEFGTHGKNK